MCEMSKRSRNIVKLNLRGTRFETLTSTLSKDPNSLLCEMMNPAYSMKLLHVQRQGLIVLWEKKLFLAEEYYFLDRSPEYFQIILDYLSQGFLEEEIPKKELLILEIEAKFYKLTKLEQEITDRCIKFEIGFVRDIQPKHDFIGGISLREKECDVIRINVSGTIFELAKSTLNKYPSCLLTQYVQGTKELKKDIYGNIYLDKDVDTYTLIFSCLNNGFSNICHRNQLLTGDCNLICSSKQEAQYLHLDILVKQFDFLLKGKLRNDTFVNLKDNLWRFGDFNQNVPDSNTLKQRMFNSNKMHKDDNGMIFLDISNKEMNIFKTKLEIKVSSEHFYNGEYKDDAVTILARKLGLIKIKEVVPDK